MRPYNPQRPLFPIHVPKCGGTSLTTTLKGWFQGGYYRHYFDEQRAQLPPRRNFRYSFWQRVLRRQPNRGPICIHGHFNAERGMGIQAYYPYVDQFITILRDPFEIAVSDYFYSKAKGQNWYVDGKPRPIADHYRDFNDYFEREVLHRTNYMLTHMPEPITLANFERVFSRRFVYVGVVEDLPTSVHRLADRLGFPRVDIPRANEAQRDEPIEAGLREAFQSNHPLEYALYAYALAHYTD